MRMRRAKFRKYETAVDPLFEDQPNDAFRQSGSSPPRNDASPLHRIVGQSITPALPLGGEQFALEPFVSPEIVAAFFSVSRSEVLRMTRERKIRGYPYKGRLRHVYRYRLSEVSEDFAALGQRPNGTIPAALASQRRKSNG
jgi:hypothetical protein